ncbi:MAG: alpha/beta hydrolase [Burkholderiales bacterium]|nr:MAG: alpha/beta hydrolase [Burkholderiales bacterium]
MAMPSFRSHLLRRVIFTLSLFVVAPARSQSHPEPNQFDPVAVVNGIEIDRAKCDDLAARDTAIWVQVKGQSRCIRYYAAGLKRAPGPNAVAALWMNGDVLGPKGNNADKRQKGFGPTKMVALEKRFSERYGVPAIYLGRPGTYGSAGKHFTTRGRPIEADLIEAALNGIKQRYGIRSWALGGHSGGGTMVAEMVARRNDLRCAVISSGASAYRAYLEARGLLKPREALTRFDPYASLNKVAVAPDRRIFVIGDPRETNVPFSAQKMYFEGLASRGHAAWLVPLRKATDARHHDLVDFGETALGLCASGASTDRIVDTLRAMPEQPARLTN